MRWTEHIKDGTKLFPYPKAVSIGDKIYCFGKNYFHRAYTDPIWVHVLNTSTLRWSLIKFKTKKNDKQRIKPCNIICESSQQTAVAYGDKVYIWCCTLGETTYNSFELLKMIFCFDIKTLEWSTPTVTGIQPNDKYEHSACIIKNKMYIFGGIIIENSPNKYSQDVHSLDLDTMQWRFINVHGTPPSPRAYHTAISYLDRMYIFGGIRTLNNVNNLYDYKEKIYCSQVYYLDTTSETWVTTNPIGTWPESREKHSAWLYNDYMYIFGGRNTNTVTYFNDLYRYSMKGNFWECLNVHGVGPFSRHQPTCSVYKDKIYLFGGVSSFNEDLVRYKASDIHVLDYAPTLKTLCIICVLEHNLDQSSLPHDIILDIRIMSSPKRIPGPNNNSRIIMV
ncbi:unnamed protein product [Euphydryas editha]|uniref:Kelch domain-containing protein 3 n=1 Tax=Euphydryas editha TaxID=104508 RepID=A0AAU9TEB6_EUPED|nr:unnamed protein product [Euphydryas editha]